MKKIMSILLSMILIIFVVPVNCFAEESSAKLSIASSSASLRRETEVTFTVSLSECDKCKSLALVFDYDTDNVFEIVKGEWLLSDAVLSDFDTKTTNSGTAVVAFANEGDINGDIFKLTLKVKKNATLGDTTIKVTPVIKNGTVKIESNDANVNVKISDAEPYFLKILTNPTNRWYTKGAEFDPTGLTARLYYKDGTTKDLGVDDLTITGFDSSTDGVRKVTVSAEGVSNQLSYKIYGIAGVRGVSIVTKPSKLIYDQGEKISFDGAVFKVINEDGTKGDVIDNSEITMYGATTLTPGKITVTFKYDSYYTTCTMKITDNKLISRYSYDSKPTKRVYSVGEEFDLEGFVANIVYFDGTTDVIDNEMIDVEGFDNTTTGVQSVTVSYLGNEITTFNVKVA